MTTTRETITIDCGAGSTMTVTAHPTTTPGLIVHDLGLFGDQYRLTHRQSTSMLGEFDSYLDAQDAAEALHGVADWTGGPEALQDEQVIWTAIDAIENAGGRFLCRKGGLGERVAAKRAAYLAARDGGAA
ncbi:hypothetical protein [Streptomyces griseosporeus]